jgi:hypothetical protein
MSMTLKDLADAAAEASAEKKEAEVLDDKVDDDGFPDPDYDSHGYIWFDEERKLFQSKGVYNPNIITPFIMVQPNDNLSYQQGLNLLKIIPHKLSSLILIDIPRAYSLFVSWILLQVM